MTKSNNNLRKKYNHARRYTKKIKGGGETSVLPDVVRLVELLVDVGIEFQQAFEEMKISIAECESAELELEENTSDEKKRNQLNLLRREQSFAVRSNLFSVGEVEECGKVSPANRALNAYLIEVRKVVKNLDETIVKLSLIVQEPTNDVRSE